MFDPYARDTGRMAETDRVQDAYRFRTPSLRNVALTAPYGHNGAYPTLEGIVRHHLAPHAALADWAQTQAHLPSTPWLAAVDFVVRDDRLEAARHAAALDIAPVALTEAEVSDIVSFLHALTGRGAQAAHLAPDLPAVVPSGLPVERQGQRGSPAQPDRP
jgi:cytochrome c peroxidase